MVFGVGEDVGHDGAHPLDGDEVLGLVAMEGEAAHGFAVAGGIGVERLGNRPDQLHRGVEAVVGGRVAGLGIAGDDRGSVDGHFVEEGRTANHLFGVDFALFVVIGEGLPDIEFRFEDAAFPQTADVGGRNVMELADAGLLADIEHVAGAVDVRAPRFALGPGADELQAGRVVQERVAAFGDPAKRAGIETQIGLADIAFEHDGARQRAAELVFPVGQGSIDALAGRGAARRPNQQGEGHPRQ